MLSLTDLRFAWPGKDGFALDVPSFEVARGETVMLLGDSGSGKSTLLSLICGTLVAQGGRVEVDGTEIGHLPPARRDRFRAETVGVIFQQFNLLPYATVADNIALPLSFAPERRRRAGDFRTESARLLSAMGLETNLLPRRAASLSIGQQQRVAVARALIGQPGLVLADEPTSALDARAQKGFLDLLFDSLRAADGTLVMVSHDERLTPRFDRVVRIEDIATVRQIAA
jgi:putative ABC transport system ATP-binding protein